MLECASYELQCRKH